MEQFQSQLDGLIETIRQNRVVSDILGQRDPAAERWALGWARRVWSSVGKERVEDPEKRVSPYLPARCAFVCTDAQRAFAICGNTE